MIHPILRHARPLVAFAFAGLPAAASAQSIIQVPSGVAGLPHDLSADGSTVCGEYSGTPFNTAFRWSAATGLVQLGSQSLRGNAINANGTIAAGTVFPQTSNIEPARFLPGGVVQLLLPGSLTNRFGQATGINGDGSVVTGFAKDPLVLGSANAFYWNNGVFNFMPNTPALPLIEAWGYALSDDGSTVFGTAYAQIPPDPLDQQVRAIRWRPGSPIELLDDLPNIPPPMTGLVSHRPTACNANGTIAVGYMTHPDFPQTRAFRWTEGVGTEELTLPQGVTEAVADGLTADGVAIVGTINAVPAPRAAYWVESYLWTDLNTYLPTVGVDLTGWVLTSCEGVSSDGTTLTGAGTLNGSPAVWYVKDIPPLCGPRIDAQPVNTTTCAFNTVQLQSVVIPPRYPAIMAYQWYQRIDLGIGFLNVPLSNGPTPAGSVFSSTSGFADGLGPISLTISNVSMADAGDYFCTITTECGSNSTAVVTLLVRPNANGDNVIDGADLSVLLANFGNTVTPWTSGDFNGDGVVNGADLSTLLSNFGEPCF